MTTETTPTATPSIIKKLQKLFALQSSSNEHEAALAAQKAQELMAKYNIEMATLSASGKAMDEDSGAVRQKTEADKKAMYKWQRTLMAAVAGVNFCHHFIATRSKWSEKAQRWQSYSVHVVVGRQANVIAAQVMFDYLCEAIERLVPIANNAQRLSKTAMSWKEGCAARLCERLNDKKWDMIRQNDRTTAASTESTGTAIVLRSVFKDEEDANWEMAHDYAPGTLALWRAKWAAEAAEKADKPVTVRTLTPAEQAKQAKEDAKWQKKWEKQQERDRRREERAWANKDMDAYYAGRDAGETIGLDTQVATDGSEWDAIEE